MFILIRQFEDSFANFRKLILKPKFHNCFLTIVVNKMKGARWLTLIVSIAIDEYLSCDGETLLVVILWLHKPAITIHTDLIRFLYPVSINCGSCSTR